MRKRRKKNMTAVQTESATNTVARRIERNKEIVTLLLAVLAAVYTISNAIYNILYQSECEKFYGVSGKYFNSSIDNRLIYLGCVILLLIFCLIPSKIKKQDEKSENSSKGYLVQTYFFVIVIGIEIGFFNVFNLVEIMKQTNKTNNLFDSINTWIDKHAYFTITMIIMLGLIYVIGLTFLNQIKKIEQVWIKKMIIGFWCFSAIISFLVMLYGTVFKLSISIENKTKYEFVMLDSAKYVVLATYDDKNLIVPFEIKDDKIYNFYTSQYKFVDVFDGIYQYVDIQYSPCVCLEEKK